MSNTNIIKIILKNEKIVKNKKILICSSVFKMKKAYKESNIYQKGVMTILKQLDKVYKKMGIVYRIYHDESIRDDKKWIRVIDEALKREYCELVEYTVPQFKDGVFHKGIFGMFMRFLPLFTGPKDWEIYECADIDNKIPLSLLQQFIKDKSIFYFKTTPCNYLIQHNRIPTLKTSRRIIGSTFMSKVQFDEKLFSDFIEDIYNKGPKYQYFVDNISKTTTPYFKNKYNLKEDKEHGMIYGVDEFFLNDVLLRYIIEHKIPYVYTILIDNYVSGLYDILEKNDNFKTLSGNKKKYYVNFCKKVLKNDYDDSKSVYENFKKIINTIQDINTMTGKNKTYNKKIIMYIKRSQNLLRQAFKDNTYEQYGIPPIIFDCINLERPIRRGDIIRPD